MNDDSIELAPPAENALHGEPRPMIRRLKRAMVISSVVGLGVTNVLVVVSETAHAFAFKAVKGALASFVSESAVSRLLQHSPSNQLERKVAAATGRLSQNLAELDRSHRSLSARHSALERVHSDLAGKHQVLGKSHQALSAQHEKLIRMSHRRSDAVRSFAKRLALRTGAGVTRNVASVPAEAIPVVGTALVIGVTSWDVYDACQTLTELNQVSSEFEHELTDAARVCGVSVPTQAEVFEELRRNWRSVYQTAAQSINQAGVSMVPERVQALSWSDLRTAVCPVMDSPIGICR